MNTYFSNTNLEPRIFDSLAAELQAKDQKLLPLSGRHAAPSKSPASIALLSEVKPFMSKVSLINLCNQIEELAQQSREAQVWRSWRSVLVVQCCLKPMAGIDPSITAELVDVTSRVFPKRSNIHLAALEYTLDLNARRVQNYRLYSQEDPVLCVGLLTQAISAAQDAGVARSKTEIR